MEKTGLTPPQNTKKTIDLLQYNLRAETNAARQYRDLAEHENNDRRKQVLIRMAEAEERHAARYEEKLKKMGVTPERPADSMGSRLSRWVQRMGGTELAIKRMEEAEDRHVANYQQQQAEVKACDAELGEMIREIEVEERAHAKALGQMTAASASPQNALDAILGRERWHGRGGGWISDAIYGVNDGLGAVFGIVSGVAGATDNAQHFVLLSGLAGMVASALSMGAGSYLAVKSEREVHEAEISREKREVEENPEEEKEELSLFYQLQGFSEEDSHKMAETMAQNPEQMVRVLAQNELGLSEEHFRNPWISAISAALSTGIGAFIPIIPFFFMGGTKAVILAFIISLIAHFLVGAAKSLITNRSWWASGGEMTIVGVIEAAVTYGLGLAFGKLG